MTIRTVALPLSDDLSHRLSRIHAAWSSKHSDRPASRRTLEYTLYEEVFRSLAKEYREDLAHFEQGSGASPMGQDGGRRRPIRERWDDPRSPERDVYLTPGMVDWESQRAPEAPPGTPGLTVRFPTDVLDRLERGLALRQAWSKQYPEGAGVKLYSGFTEWAEEQVALYVRREYDRLQDEEIAKEEDELYPGLNEKPKTTTAPAAPPPRPSPPVPAMPVGPKWEPPFAVGRAVNPHRPHRKGPMDR